jgi:hypothetical protein
MTDFTGFRRLALLFLLIAPGLSLLVRCQEAPQKEYVEVVNAEMILRVLQDGAPVGGLKKSDFSLYEDGEKGEINGFLEVRRRIAADGTANRPPRPPRLYLLFFWVGNPAADVEGALDKFFSAAYREGDRVILSTPARQFEILSGRDKERIRNEFLEQWRQDVKRRLMDRLQFVNDLNRLIETQVIGLIGKPAGAQMKSLESFAIQYAWAIKEFQLRELTPDLNALEAMARSLLAVQNEKFALVFFQRDSLPLLDSERVGDHCLLNGIRQPAIDALKEAMTKIETQAKSIFDLRDLSAALRALFIQANTQFHLLFLAPDRGDSQGLAGLGPAFTKAEEVFSGWDLVMRQISESTGGLTLAGDRMADVLDQVVSFEDIYYHVTYVPREGGRNLRRIDVRVKRPGVKVVYGRTLELKALPRVKIADVTAAGGVIRIALTDFYAIPRNGVPTGFVDVTVTGRRAGREPSRLLLSQARETSGALELPLELAKPGEWDIEVRVVDQFTGKEDVKAATWSIAAAVPAAISEADPDPALIPVLARAAAYAERLKREAFHFICREDVSQEVFAIDEHSVRTRVSRHYWKYDYQIIGQDGAITERRVLLEKDRRKMRQEQACLETAFRSHFSFYMPVTLLAAEKQPLYRYRLLDKKKSGRETIWHVAATPLDRSRPVPWGEVWVSEEDGAVWKVQIEEVSIVGFDKLVAGAKRKDGFVPAITTLHEYGVIRGAVRFPSRTIFIERYRSDDEVPKTWGGMAVKRMAPGRFSFERSRTYFEYKGHRFFQVETRVEETVG